MVAPWRLPCTGSWIRGMLQGYSLWPGVAGERYLCGSLLLWGMLTA